MTDKIIEFPTIEAKEAEQQGSELPLIEWEDIEFEDVSAQKFSELGNLYTAINKLELIHEVDKDMMRLHAELKAGVRSVCRLNFDEDSCHIETTWQRLKRG